MFIDNKWVPAVSGETYPVVNPATEEEVIELDNDNKYGLVASIWTRDLGKARLMANKLKAGTVYVNNHEGMPAKMPWGGFKESSINKENGVIGLEGYTQLKVIQLV